MNGNHTDLRYSFTGHESFPFRFAWLPKGVSSALERPDIFVRDDAPVLLGVGKNMVASIRHWCQVLDLIRAEGRPGWVQVTELGRCLLSVDGWDPYLEDPGTLWLLHWLLVRRPDRASTWHLAFTRWSERSFTRDRLVDWLTTTIAREAPSSRATVNSLRRDVDVFLRTYVSSRPRRDLPIEETFDCPLVELGLVEEAELGGFRFHVGPQPSLPLGVWTFALLDYWGRVFSDQRTLTFERVLHDEGSPGAAFKLSENSVAERLEKLPSWSGMRYDETAGVRLIVAAPDAVNSSPERALERYYARVAEAHPGKGR